ncbi:MAG TPA: fumarylacetoacetase [Acidimicrobiia bacterium]|jgi:fumarylacetoacetase
MTWVDVPADSGFPLENLPFGVVRAADRPATVVVRLGDHVVDLAAAGIEPSLTAQPSLNAVMASGRGLELRERAAEHLTGPARPQTVYAVRDVDVVMPFAVADYVDFYSSLQHATNMGRILRPDDEPLMPNWRHLPVGYHGRAGSVVVSGTPVVRPSGLVAGEGDAVGFRPTARLDFELEVGFVVGRPGSGIAPDDAGAHVFGAVLVNDWSARDIQAYEYRPLGPNLGKSFATTISPWVVTLDALQPYLVPSPVQDPPPAPYLRADGDWALDLQLAVSINGDVVSRTGLRDLYWTFAQQLAHMTVNGATARTGDLFASGTVSGDAPDSWGSLMELSWGGARPVQLAHESARTFLEDGDTVVLRGACCAPGKPRIGFGEAAGTVVPGRSE